jgi:hypothetical protein
MRCSVVALLTVSPLFGQTSAGKLIKTTLCQLISDPQRFNGKLVEIRSEFVSRFEWQGFVDQTCSAKVRASAYGVLDDLRAQDGQTHLPVAPKQDHNYRAFRKYADTKFKWPYGGRCQDCPLYRILVTADGRFDYFAGQTVAVGANPEGKAVGIPGGDLPLLRFALQSVADVAATPIDPSIYSEKKPRDVTLEEANELVLAFFRDHGESRPDLEEYEVKDYPGLQLFQALWPNAPRHPGQPPLHSAVDLRTGQVWSEDSCENLTSPSLKKLQKAIRTRIGLTADEFRRVRRRGPLCDE